MPMFRVDLPHRHVDADRCTCFCRGIHMLVRRFNFPPEVDAPSAPEVERLRVSHSAWSLTRGVGGRGRFASFGVLAWHMHFSHSQRGSRRRREYSVGPCFHPEAGLDLGRMRNDRTIVIGWLSSPTRPFPTCVSPSPLLVNFTIAKQRQWSIELLAASRLRDHRPSPREKCPSAHFPPPGNRCREKLHGSS